MLPHFTRDHVGNLDERSMLAMVGTRAHILETSPPGSAQSLTHGRAVVLDDSLLLGWEIDKKDLIRDDAIGTAKHERHDAIANAIEATGGGALPRTPGLLFERVDVSTPWQALD